MRYVLALWLMFGQAKVYDYNNCLGMNPATCGQQPKKVYVCTFDGEPFDCSNLGEKQEPIDVPAIQEDYVAHVAGEQSFNCNPADYCKYEKDDIEKRWTCADKSRGLWETLDGKHYCHKAQL